MVTDFFSVHPGGTWEAHGRDMGGTRPKKLVEPPTLYDGGWTIRTSHVCILDTIGHESADAIPRLPTTYKIWGQYRASSPKYLKNILILHSKKIHNNRTRTPKNI